MRRKSVKCLLCQSRETKADNGICYECNMAWKAGNYYLSLPADDKPEQVVIGDRVNVSPALRGTPPHQKRDEEELVKSILALAGAKQIEFKESGPGFKPAHVMFNPWQGRRYVLRAGVNPADIKDLIESVKRLTSAAWDDGYKSGSNFIARLARGEVSISELTEGDKNEQRDS